MINEILEKAGHHMDRAIEEVKHNFSTVRAGKASPAILDPIRVDYYGSPTPLNQVANVSCPEPRMIVIQPWEKNMLAPIEKAIMTSDLGLNPGNDGSMIRVPLPELSEERRKELVKHVHKLAEDGKVAVRNVRRDANDHLKKALKASEISEDDERRALKEVQDLTDKHIENIDKLMADKEKDIMAV
jgi:ribosome recycling factor